jgi:hypothetical protein
MKQFNQYIVEKIKLSADRFNCPDEPKWKNPHAIIINTSKTNPMFDGYDVKLIVNGCEISSNPSEITDELNFNLLLRTDKDRYDTGVKENNLDDKLGDSWFYYNFFLKVENTHTNKKIYMECSLAQFGNDSVELEDLDTNILNEDDIPNDEILDWCIGKWWELIGFDMIFNSKDLRSEIKQVLKI